MRSDDEARWDRPWLRELLASLGAVPAFVHDTHLTVIAANRLAAALSPIFEEGVNLARATFLAPLIDRDSDQWPTLSEEMTALLWAEVERSDLDLSFIRIVGELAALSRPFAEAWAQTPRLPRARGRIHFAHAIVGPITLAYVQLFSYDGEEVLVLWRATDALSAVGLAALAATLTDPA